MNGLFKNYKKAGENTYFIWILFAILLFLVLVFTNVLNAGEQMKKVFPFLKNCRDYGGTCIPTKDSCDSSSKLVSTKSYTQGTEACPDLNKQSQVCCMPQPTPGSQTTSTPSAECNGKKSGDACSTATPTNKKVCDDSLQCVTRCVYCNDHTSNTALCPATVAYTINNVNTNVAIRYGSLSCGCTSLACNGKKASGDCLTISTQSFCDASADFCCNGV